MLTTGCKGGSTSDITPFADDYVLGVLQDYMKRFPESQLRDVYKFCFQDYFGPEHLVSDSARVAQYIVKEIDDADTGDWLSPLFIYPLGLEGNFVRFDLNYVRKKIVDVGSLASAFVKSSQGWLDCGERSLEEWQRQWSQIERLSRRLSPLPKNFDEDSALIAEALAAGQYAFHHSKLYNETYHQHYRIVREDIAKELIGDTSTLR